MHAPTSCIFWANLTPFSLKSAGGPCPGNTLLHAVSADGGESFGPPQCAVPYSACQASILSVGGGILVSNPQGPVSRHGMTISRSTDSGRTFEARHRRWTHSDAPLLYSISVSPYNM